MEGNKRLISPINIYSRVKEELRTYFNTGSIDDLLFNLWCKDCIDKFEYTYLPLQQAVLDMYNHKCPLPCDFKAVREVWVTFCVNKGPITSPHVFYYQTDCRINPAPSQGQACGPCVDGYQCFPPSQTPTPVALPSLCDVPPEYIVTHKVMDQMFFQFHVTGMLKPGNFKTIGKCHEDSPNLDAHCMDTFDIMGNNIITSFSHGTIYLAYFGTHATVQDNEGQDEGYYLIPDNEWFKKYLYYYLRYMVYRQLFDQCTGDTFKEIQVKMQVADKEQSDAYTDARNYAMSPTAYDIQKSIIRSYNRNNRFGIK